MMGRVHIFIGTMHNVVASCSQVQIDWDDVAHDNWAEIRLLLSTLYTVCPNGG